MSTQRPQSTLDRLDPETRLKWGCLTPEGDGVPTPDTVAEEARRRQLGGFFEGEGCIRLSISNKQGSRLNHGAKPQIKIKHAELAGFAEAEGCVSLDVMKHSNNQVGYCAKPCFRLVHTQQDGVGEKLERYRELAGGDGCIYRRTHSDESQPTVSFSVGSKEGSRRLLSKLYPWLGHKQRQAEIMLTEILPMMERGDHHEKRGFIELMKWKKKLDETKPMDDADRKYTVEYFEELWADDLEAQTEIDEW